MTKANTERPEINTNVYGKSAPDAAKAGVGARSLEQINQAIDARRNQKPGQYYGERR
jgi:hypothetical protein